MNGRLARKLCQQAVGFDLFLSAPGGKLKRIGIRLGNAARHNHAACVLDVQNITGGKRAFDLANANGQKRGTVVGKGMCRTIIHRHGAMGLVAQSDPQLARSDIQMLDRRRKQSSHALAAGDAHQGIRFGTGTDNARDNGCER